jgi:hypothetical protein
MKQLPVRRSDDGAVPNMPSPHASRLAKYNTERGQQQAGVSTECHAPRIARIGRVVQVLATGGGSFIFEDTTAGAGPRLVALTCPALAHPVQTAGEVCGARLRRPRHCRQQEHTEGNRHHGTAGSQQLTAGGSGRRRRRARAAGRGRRPHHTVNRRRSRSRL